MVIIGNSGFGKTKLLFKFSLENYFDFNKIVFASPFLSQTEYEVIIKSLQKGFQNNKIRTRTIFEEHEYITTIDSTLDIITSNDKFKRNDIEVVTYQHPDDIPLPNELNPRGVKRTLVIVDDCTIINSVNPTELYVFGRPLNIITIYLLQKYNKVP